MSALLDSEQTETADTQTTDTQRTDTQRTETQRTEAHLDKQSTKSDGVNINEIMTRVRSMVAEKLVTPRAKFQPTPASAGSSGQTPIAGELLHSPELRIINQRHAYSLDVNPQRVGTSHRGGFLGRLVTSVKRRFLVFLRDAILADYLKAEHEFQSALTQYLNAMTRYIDQRDSADFWNLVHKIDVDTDKSIERIDRIADEVHGSLATLRREMEEKWALIGRSALVSTNDVPNNSPLTISPAMPPQMVTLVRQVNSLSQKVEALSKNTKD